MDAYVAKVIYRILLLPIVFLIAKYGLSQTNRQALKTTSLVALGMFISMFL